MGVVLPVAVVVCPWQDFERERKWQVGQAKRTAGRALRQLQEFVSRHERQEKVQYSPVQYRYTSVQYSTVTSASLIGAGPRPPHPPGPPQASFLTSAGLVFPCCTLVFH